ANTWCCRRTPAARSGRTIRKRRPRSGCGRWGSSSTEAGGAVAAARAPDPVDFDLTPRQKQGRDGGPGFAPAEPGDKIAPYDARHEFPHEIVAKLGPLGFMGVLVPEEYGGAGLDYVSYALIVEELNRGDASVGITMWAHNSLCTNHINLFGSAEQ